MLRNLRAPAMTLRQIEHGKTAAAEVEEQFVDTGVSNATREDVAQVLRSVDSQTDEMIEEKKEEVLEVRRGGLAKARWTH